VHDLPHGKDIMKFSCVFLLCLILILCTGTAQAVKGIAPWDPEYISCSPDTMDTEPGSGGIDVYTDITPPYIFIDGNDMARGSMSALVSPGGVIHYVVDYIPTGSHDLDLRASASGYYDYYAVVQICDRKTTYVYHPMVPVPTPAPTPVTTQTVQSVATINSGSLEYTTLSKIRTVAPVHTTTVATTAPATIATVSQTAAVTANPTASADATTEPARTSSLMSTRPPVAATTGSLSVITTPAGAYVFIDGAQRGISPATIPGLAPGDHTLLLKMEGYEDLTTSVAVIAGDTQQYSSGLVPKTVAINTTATIGNTTAGTKKGIAPGFEFGLAFAAIGAIMALKKSA
jgi:hypothetical protein